LIEDVREEVREIDEQIIKLVVMRRKLAEKILEAKKVDKIKINDEEQKKRFCEGWRRRRGRII
jgi:Chorismate mutase type II.